MRKMFCDICGREIPSVGFNCEYITVSFSRPGKIMDKEIEICKGCFYDLNKWITEKRTER